jgi:hypothetical protein
VTTAYTKPKVKKYHYEKRCRGHLPSSHKCPCTLHYSVTDVLVRPGVVEPEDKYGSIGHYVIICPCCGQDTVLTRWEVHRVVGVFAVENPRIPLPNIPFNYPDPPP